MAVFIWLSSQPHNNNTPLVTRVLLKLMVMTSSNSGDELISTFQLSKWYSSDSTYQVISSIQLSKWYSLDSDYQAISIIQISIWSWNKICHMVSYYIFFNHIGASIYLVLDSLIFYFYHLQFIASACNY